MVEKSGRHSQPKDYKLIVEKDVKIPLRDGTLLYADVFRPDGASERFPVIMNTGPEALSNCVAQAPRLQRVESMPTCRRGRLRYKNRTRTLAGCEPVNNCVAQAPRLQRV